MAQTVAEVTAPSSGQILLWQTSTGVSPDPLPADVLVAGPAVLEKDHLGDGRQCIAGLHDINANLVGIGAVVLAVSQRSLGFRRKGSVADYLDGAVCCG